MTIECVFSGHSLREGLCDGKATSFFRSAKGTVWALCTSCADQHKRVSIGLAKQGRLAIKPLAGATFDIPLDDPETLAIWESQGPETVQGIIQAVDYVTKRSVTKG